jgi:GNAT superfamily N-acetyltransferase
MSEAAVVNVPVHMARPDVRDYPACALPAGYHFRTYGAGDEAHWTALHRAAERFFPIDDAMFGREFGEHMDALADRMFFVETDDGLVVASITAWWERDRHNPQERGRIHWVVVHPDHQRRGLSKPMMTRAMQRLAQSHSAAMLGTSSGRPWALKVYLDFGFGPDMDELAAKPEVAAAWRSVQELLQHPRLAAALA